MKDTKVGCGGVLRSLVAVLVDEWGVDAVRVELEQLSASASGLKRQSEKIATAGAESRTKEKPSALALATKVSLPPAQKQLVQDLAAKFDDKQFLPSAGDIKYFFEVHGETAPSAKQRSEAFRRVLRLLSSLPEASLRKIISDGLHGGPSSLAPLSDAMRDVGAKRASGEIQPNSSPEDGAATSSDA